MSVLASRSLNWKLWVGLAISALFIYLALREVSLAEVWSVIRSTDFLPLGGVIIITFFQYLIRAWRWRILLEPIKNTAFMNRLHAVLIGFAANCVLPARLGEFIRANYLGHAENISGSSSFATLIVERLFDGFTLLLILFIGLWGTTFSEEFLPVAGSLRATGSILLIGYILLIVVLVGFKYRTKPFLTFLERLLFFIPKGLRARTIDIVRNFSLGLVLLKDPGRWTQAVMYSLLLWSTSLYQVELVEHAVGFDLPPIAPFLVLAMASLGVMIPSAPGFIGTFHLSVQYAFVFYGIDKEAALSAAILWHAALFFPTVLLGLLSFLHLHIPYSRLAGRTLAPNKE
jgi:uncharacterized protein (TIRG00374 family)